VAHDHLIVTAALAAVLVAWSVNVERQSERDHALQLQRHSYE